MRFAGLLRIALLLLSSALGLAIVEFGLRFSAGADGQAYSVNPTGSQYKFYMFDRKLGWANGPDMRGVYERDEFRFPIRINAHRMRDAPVSLERGERFRIAVLGDSFTWGIGVADEDRFTEKMESLFDVEALNFGVSGYSPVQYALMMDEVLRFEPDLVIIAFCLANDFADNVFFERYGYFKPYASLSAEGALQIQGYPLANVDDFGMRERSGGFLIMQRIRSWIQNCFLLPEQQGLIGFSNRDLYDVAQLNVEAEARAEEAIAINAALFEMIRDRIADSGAALAIAPVPTKCEYSSRCRNESDPAEQTVQRGAYSALERTAGRLGIVLIPTLDALDGSDFWLKDGHWRPSGHEKFARRLGGELESRGLLRRAAPLALDARP